MPESSPGARTAAARGYFPYAFTPPAHVPRYARYRAEGRSPYACLWGTLSYLRKYRNKLRAAPEEELAYFDHQRQLLRLLAAEPRQACNARLATVGDIMWVRNGWASFLSEEVLAYLNGHDVVLGNLETTISQRFKVPTLLPDYLRFNSEPALITSFRRPDGRSTFTALSLANNHILDYGDAGARDTMAFLDRQQILHTGAREDGDRCRPFVTFTAGGITLGFCAASWGSNAPRQPARSAVRINTVDGLAPDKGADADLSELRGVLEQMGDEGVEVKIVSLHWGFEYELYPSPGTMQVGREIVRAGADVIVGSHPHVPQPAEVCFVNGYETRYGDLARRYPAMSHPSGCVIEDGTGQPRKAIIFYSLGNFVSAMYTFLCEVGVIRGLELGREPSTGRVDWFHPQARFVYNVRRHPASGTRRLMFLGRYLREATESKRLSQRAHEDLALLSRHIVAEG